MKNTTSLTTIAQHTGLLLMTAAATLGMVDIPEHMKGKIVLAAQPTFAFATEKGNDNPIRREKEEVGAHYVSYSINQRTPARSGKQ